MLGPTNRGRKNARWQQIADQTWYLYVQYYSGESRRFKYEAGTERARAAAKAHIANPAVKSLTVFSSKIARDNGTAEKFRWTRENGWK